MSAPAQAAQKPRVTLALQPLAVGALMLGGLLLQFVTLKAPANFYDEGLVLLNASRILNGEVPYRDFWTLYAPGYFYVLAGLFKGFGASILVARIFDTLVRFLVTVVVYRFARRLVPWWAALIPYGLVSLWLGSLRFYVYPAFPALGTIFLALICFARYLDGGRPRWLLLSGLSLGLTAALRLDFGGYAAVGVGLALLVRESLAAWQRARAARPVVVAALRAELFLAGGLAAVMLPLFGGLALVAGADTLWNQLVQFPATTFRAVRHLPLPSPLPDFFGYSGENWEDWFRLYVPIGVFLAALAYAGSVLWNERNDLAGNPSRAAVLFVALALTGFGLVVKATSRYHDLHAMPAAFLASVTLVALLARLPARAWRRWPVWAALVFLGLAALLNAYVLHFTGQFAQVSAFRWDGCYSTIERAGCVPLDPNQAAAVEVARARTSPDEYVFVGNMRHDQIFVNDVLFYFLLDRPVPTRYTELHPGLATTREVQREIIAELEEKDVRWLVVAQGFLSGEPNASAVSSGVNDLDEFIQENYDLVSSNPLYHLLNR